MECNIRKNVGGGHGPCHGDGLRFSPDSTLFSLLCWDLVVGEELVEDCPVSNRFFVFGNVGLGLGDLEIHSLGKVSNSNATREAFACTSFIAKIDRTWGFTILTNHLGRFRCKGSNHSNCLNLWPFSEKSMMV